MAQGFRAPNQMHYSQVAVGWLTEPETCELGAQVAGWDEVAWEATRWAIQVHGIGPLLHQSLSGTPAAEALHPRLRS
ncbi:MAG TPA: hypothetical protein VFO07_00690, partial [Roseiflexaceae bacterium]|nr:hypothetical protein [Roseiflexaceae bacterium]